MAAAAPTRTAFCVIIGAALVPDDDEPEAPAPVAPLLAAPVLVGPAPSFSAPAVTVTGARNFLNANVVDSASLIVALPAAVASSPATQAARSFSASSLQEAVTTELMNR